MTSRSFSIAVGAAAATIGVVLVGVTLHLADQSTQRAANASGGRHMRPGFALDSPTVSSRADGDATTAGVREQRLAALVDETTRFFALPDRLLGHVLYAEPHRRGHAGWSLDPVPREIIQTLNTPDDPTTERATRDLCDFLGYDPRPLDSHLTRRPEVGIAVRAAYLKAQYASYEDHLVTLGLVPAEPVVWTLAVLTMMRGDQEVTACIEEALSGGARRRGLSFSEPAATFAQFTDERFVLRAFLREWDEGEARKRRPAFVAAVRSVLPIIETEAIAAIDDEGIEGG